MEFYYHEMENDVLIISADGGLNKQTASKFVDDVGKLVDGGIKKIIIDCSKLNFITSYGIGILLRIHKKLRAAGGDVKIAAVPSRIIEVLNIMKLTRIFSIYPDVNRARLEFRPKDA
ncbi:MAG TPA: STAS domain-containing protein [Phycisphaerae bacterium]|nr:STAS domain-containing protein [Phycisphaerae bacterium]HPS53242.1 STAS domain-containing protein [Phycisphaerae bacterium]